MSCLSAPSRSRPFAAGRGWWPWYSAPSAWGWRRGCFICSCAPAAGTPTVPSASNCGTPSCPRTGEKFTAPTAFCWRRTAAAGRSAPRPARCQTTSSPLPPRALQTSWTSTRPTCWNRSATAAPTTACSATGWTAPPPTGCGQRHHRHPHQSGLQTVVSAGAVPRVGAGVHQCGQRRGLRAGAAVRRPAHR